VIKEVKRRGEFGRRISALRAANALTASDLARLTDVTPAAIWQWEKNGTTPRRSTIEKVAKQFNVPVSELTGETKPVERAATEKPRLLSDYPLEDLLTAIEGKGFTVTIQRKRS
jgi:transcriptional regulator with XRE-family HTH domain